ncbi:hypothetical protein mgb1_023 [Bacillus phage MG-B1]|uniref:Uncharacterized protein n=1 Tax=Bacillus phage MG-B1 TaxID=1309583 RepID=M4W8C7_9CAUD|nr:hypothetical protein mgb1_023 [Bacillus phage MG-B1]AGI10612.1 hypothetical protein mgb1_023 [Bacillus phage MG-B1]
MCDKGVVFKMEMEVKIESGWGNINEGYLPVLKEYGYKEEPSTIYLTHLHDIFDLQEKLKSLNLKTTLTPSIIVEGNKLFIYDDWLE